MSRHRRRSVAFGALALVLALVALYGFGGSSGRPSLEPMQRVVSMRRPVASGQRIAPADLAMGAVPVTWANPHQLADPGVAVGQLAAVALPAGAPLMDSELARRRRPVRTAGTSRCAWTTRPACRWILPTG